MKQTEENFHQTTDDFSFHSADRECVQIDFGTTRVSLSNYAARDLVYRLASYLVFLEHGEQAPAVSESLAAESAPDMCNVLPFLPNRESHD